MISSLFLAFFLLTLPENQDFRTRPNIPAILLFAMFRVVSLGKLPSVPQYPGITPVRLHWVRERVVRAKKAPVLAHWAGIPPPRAVLLSIDIF